MKNESIIYFSKCVFGLFFLLGNICLFGNLITGHVDFAIYGYLLLIFGSVCNLLIVSGIMVYGCMNVNQIRVCCKASLIICINIPIAVLYAFIGINFNTI